MDTYSESINNVYNLCFEDTENKFSDYYNNPSVLSLRNNFKYNLNLGRATLNVLHNNSLHKSPGVCVLEMYALHETLEVQTDTSSFEYILLHNLIYVTKMLEIAFPNALRATIHPKEG